MSTTVTTQVARQRIADRVRAAQERRLANAARRAGRA